MKRILSLLLTAAMALSLLPAAALAADSGAYVLMNIPYGEFFAGEGVSGVDAVSSATVKTYNQTMAGGSYHDGYDAPEDIQDAKILGVTYPVYVEDTSVLEGLTEVKAEDTATITVASGKSSLTTKEVSGSDLLFASGDYAYYVLEETPESYKTLTVSDDQFSFSAVQGTQAALANASATISAYSRYGDYEVSVSTDDPAILENNVSGILLTSGDETYALRHVENIWRKTGIAWSVSDPNFAGLVGKTITKITFITAKGTYTMDTNLLVEDKNTEVYGTMEVPYADFYKALGVTYDVDAVTSATGSKWKQNEEGKLVAGTYNETVEDDESGKTGRILGVTYPVKISVGDLAMLGRNNGNFTPLEEQPKVYLDATAQAEGRTAKAVFNGIEGEPIPLTEAGATLTTLSSYGDYQISVTGTSSFSHVSGVLLKMEDGSLYGLRHLENIWRSNGAELAWSVGYVTETHGNTLSYENFKSTEGKTVKQITYITRDGIYTIDTDLYLPLKFDGTVSVEDALTTAGSTKVTLSGMPEDYVPQYAIAQVIGKQSVPVEGISVVGDTLSFPADLAKGSYKLTVSDQNGKYSDLSGSFQLQTAGMPAAYDADKKAVVASEGASEESFADFIKNISSVTVNGTAYAAGHHGVTIVNSEGTIDLEKGGMTEAKVYEVTVAATGYAEQLTFQVDLRGEQTITGAANFTKTYGDAAFALGAKADGQLTYKSSNTAVAAVSTAGKVTIKGAGTANITVTAAETETVKAATKTVKITVAKAAQTVTTGAASYAKTYGDAAFALSAKTTGDGKLTYKSSNTAVATVSTAGKVTVKGAGTANITVTAAATGNYKAGTKTVKVTVKKCAQTITVTAKQTKLVTDKAFNLNAKLTGKTTSKLTYTSNKTAVATVNANGLVTIKGTGTAKITIKAAANANANAAANKIVTITVGAPKVVQISSVKAVNGGKATVKWAKNAAGTGYEIQYSLKKTFAGAKSVKIKKSATVSTTLNGLTKNKTYFVRIRVYKTIGSKTFNSGWSKTKNVLTLKK